MTQRRNDAGQVLPLVAICLASLMGFAGMGVDVGYLDYQQRQLQSAADAAALGGARQLALSGCTTTGAIATAADNDAAANGFANGGNNTVTVTYPPPNSGPYGGNACAVEVQINQKYAATFFTKLFGYQKGMPETTQAIAYVNANGTSSCMYLLSPTARSIFNGDTVSAPTCSILINDTATFNGDPSFASPYIGYAGAAPIENGSTFTKATPAPMLTVGDPCPEITGCNYVASNPLSASGCTSATFNGQATANIPAGCYNSLIINGCTNVNFSGQYVFNGTTIINGATNVTGSNVTMYVTAGGTPPTFNGIPNVSLSAPTTGNYAGVLYYQVPSNTQSPIFNGNTQSLSGLIYAPGATNVIFNGTSGGYLVIVVGAATFNGSNAYDFASPPPNGSIVKQEVLGE